MIIGIWMGLETCKILGQVSHTIYPTRRKTSRRVYVVRMEINKKTAYIQARSSMARAMEVNGKHAKLKGEAKVV